MAASFSSPHESESVEETAAQWLARRDRGLSAAEQDEYLQWLQHDPRHGAAIARFDKAWQRLDSLVEWRPEHSAEPNPQLLAPGRKTRRWFWGMLPAAMAIAATVAVVAYRGRVSEDIEAPPAVQAQVAGDGIVRHEARRMTLPDGSLVQLNTGADVEVAFLSSERRVRLRKGEAHFTVTKDASRPFLVEAGGVVVRAVGTAFNVERDAGRIAVLVTEGTVSLDRLTPSAKAEDSFESAILTAGQRAVVISEEGSSAPIVTVASALEIEHELAWQALRLEFAELPLAEVVAEFNRYNQRKLVVGDSSAGAVRVGGTFRADNVDAFVRLLEAGFGVRASLREDGTTVLSRDR